MISSATLKEQVKSLLWKEGLLSLQEWAEKKPGEHLDVTHNGLTFCALCGYVLPRKGHSKPCKGITGIDLR